jgi:hypothetical protein
MARSHGIPGNVQKTEETDLMDGVPAPTINDYDDISGILRTSLS